MEFLNVEDFAVIEDMLSDIESDLISATKFYKEEELSICIDDDILFIMDNSDIIRIDVRYFGDYNSDEKAIFLLGLNNLTKMYDVKLIDLQKEEKEIKTNELNTQNA
jgi:hypothetical protein